MAIADLGALGFWGFATVTFVAGTVDCGWYAADNRGLYYAFLMFGGLGQVIAGLVDILRGNAAGGVILTAFGIHWCGEGISAWPGLSEMSKSRYDDQTQLLKMIGFYKLVWALISLPMIYVMFRASMCQGVTLTVVCIIFALHSLACFLDGDAAENVHKVSGYLCIIAALLAYYMGCSLYLRASGAPGLPFGRPLFVDEEELKNRTRATGEEIIHSTIDVHE
ncbi:GPR1/FUN34/yaaH family protein [Gregarina niphandrodes]|uniref:GPR1/FUN34/yaaH family protein n=1 Tax=Gregarina niphandrodes TaxID=110365 RepID=A0A023BD15_GRENI|nr:GPR1/FUN34/yaaH family protein [Gregarina niphandrodes]EZG86970.1 GPR1/FUN34/yaaH family protein [Gregarina niphandrodes]|eukprot:XP_011128726.1 GPR1/FUN34/yaaH family protein [Gregarina niphandrodes]